MDRMARGLALSLLAALTGAGCAGHRPTTAIAPASWDLRVENHYALDVTVFVLHGGVRSRVGMITATQTGRFHLPMYLVQPGGDIMLVARALGDGMELATEMILVERGSQVDLFIPRAFEHTAVSVR